MDATGQGLIINVLGKELDGEGKVTEGQVLADMMHEVGKCAVGEWPAGKMDQHMPCSHCGDCSAKGLRSSLALVPIPTLSSSSCSTERPSLSPCFSPQSIHTEKLTFIHVIKFLS